MKETNVLQDLKDFEKEQEQKLLKMEENEKKSFEKAKKSLEDDITNENEILAKKRDKQLSESREKAKKDAKSIIKDYSNKKDKIKQQKDKNEKKAVEKLLKKLVE